MIVLLRLIIVVMGVVLMVFSLASKEDKEPKWKWQIIGAILAQGQYSSCIKKRQPKLGLGCLNFIFFLLIY